MPSLRRTVSSPMVRASPYHYPSSLSAGTGAGAGANSGMAAATRVRRACSGSEPNSARRARTVLADIEWWRVLDGQDPEGNDSTNGADVDQDQDQDQDRQIDAEAAPVLDAVGGMMHASEWDAADMDVTFGEPGALSITTPFAALSISAMLPTTPPRRRSGMQREASDASDVSSSESTPEPSPSGTSFADALASMGSVEGAFGLGFDLGFPASTVNASSNSHSSRAELFSSALLLDAPNAGQRPSSLGAAFMLRSVSFNGFEAPREHVDDRFGDVVFL